MSRFRENFARFMSGRNGFDEFSRFLSIVALIILLIGVFIPFAIPKYILGGLGFAIYVYAYFRIFSRNYAARSRENQWFLSIKYRNKGYGSAAPIAALKKYGPTPIHRRSFIKNFV